jgi:hypothetical protein
MLKLILMSLGILQLPGSEEIVLQNSYNEEIDVSWFPIVSACLSATGILFGGLWIVQPIADHTHWLTGKLAFVPLFFYRMTAWIIILFTLESFSFVPFVTLISANFLVIWGLQEKLVLEPLSSSCLSIVFPMFKLPSQDLDSEMSMKIFFWLIIGGNSLLLLVNIFIYLLYHYGAYNPWCNERPGVNYTNIIRAAFLYESFAQSFFVLRFKVCTFLGQKYRRKSCL